MRMAGLWEGVEVGGVRIMDGGGREGETGWVGREAFSVVL